MASAVPATAVLLFGLGSRARDGVSMLSGFAARGAAFLLILSNPRRLAAR